MCVFLGDISKNNEEQCKLTTCSILSKFASLCPEKTVCIDQLISRNHEFPERKK